jgi:hypothetical protein
MLKNLPAALAGLLTLTALATAQPQPAADAAPGLIIRLYDIGLDMQALPQLVPGELPNIIEVIPTIDLKEGGFFGLKDRFLTVIEGILRVDQSGSFTVQIASDDGARVWIDDRLIVDHDGLHGPEAKGAGVNLNRGDHAIRVEHFDNTGGEQLTVLWRGGDQKDFAPIPPSMLFHSPTTSKQTTAGLKKLIPPLRRGLPGDGTPVSGGHPTEATLRMNPIGRDDERARWITDNRVRNALDRQSVDEANAASFVAWLFPQKGGRPNQTVNQLGSEPYMGDLLFVAPGEVFRYMPDPVGDREQGAMTRFSNVAPGSTRTPKRSSVFELAGVRVLSNGLEIEFTEPLDPRAGWEADSYHIEQWPFDLAAGERPKRDGRLYAAKSASVSEDRRRVFLELDGLKPGHVVYLRLLPPCISETLERPWATEAWYTLHEIPADRRGEVRPRPEQPPANVLTEDEKKQGWRLLFDGKTTHGWRGFGKQEAPVGPTGEPGWSVIDGCLVRTGPGGDLITTDQFENFELSLEWRVSPGGNSGIFYRVAEGPDFQWVWQTGPEMQVLDNAEHRDSRSPVTSAGANYALHAASADVTQPVGLFNHAAIIVKGSHVEHWLNNQKLLEYELNSQDWKERVAASKFATMKAYGQMRRGHIALQDHGDRVWFRNIKIRELPNE